ncbi:YbfB/YjiJ family MFS transporter [Candidatus Enterovibrio escicola]|uniref:YbfB/YjiJ family MFS transporter n=1 Tax=Candidatus Enterovibrio escicola TaxID=1927127 RepID=UPI00123816AA|nr:MFS transporter [Candidatus Enterovibrio escacola]
MRIYGSVGILSACLLTGWLIERYSIDIALPVVSLLYVFIGIVTITCLPNTPNENKTELEISTKKIFNILRKKEFLYLMIFVTVFRIPFTFFNINFFSMMLQKGSSASFAGASWTIAFTAEIVMFLVITRMKLTLSKHHIWLAVAALISALRWFLIFKIDNLYLLNITQVIHGITFVLFYSICMKIISNMDRSSVENTVQAIFYIFCYGISELLGSIACGYINAVYGIEFSFFLRYSLVLRPLFRSIKVGVWVNIRWVFLVMRLVDAGMRKRNLEFRAVHLRNLENFLRWIA